MKNITIRFVFALFCLTLIANSASAQKKNPASPLIIGIGARYLAPLFPAQTLRANVGGLHLSAGANFQWIGNRVSPFFEPGIYGAYARGTYSGWGILGVGAGTDFKLGMRIGIWYFYAGAAAGYEKYTATDPCGCDPETYVIQSGWYTRYNAGTGFQFGEHKNWRIGVQLELPTNTNFAFLKDPPIEAATLSLAYRF